MIKEKLDTVQQAYTFLSDFYKFIAKFQFMSKESIDVYLKNNKEEEELIGSIFSKCQEIGESSKTLDRIIKSIDISHKAGIVKSESPTIIS